LRKRSGENSFLTKSWRKPTSAAGYEGSKRMADRTTAILSSHIAAIRKGIAAADLGMTVPHRKVKEWAKSLGTRRKLPRPTPKYLGRVRIKSQDEASRARMSAARRKRRRSGDRGTSALGRLCCKTPCCAANTQQSNPIECRLESRLRPYASS
jgi:hypothetical protein